MPINKKIVFAGLIFCLIFSSCLKKSGSMDYEKIKVGFIYPGAINDKGYCQAQEKARIALDKINVKTMYAENVPEDVSCIETVKTLINLGCKIIYAASEPYAKYIFEIARKYPEIKFLVCSSSQTAPNVASYFGKMYEVRYLSGIVAGLKTNTNKIGYVAAFKNSECLRGLNAFTLGVQSVNPDAVVEVKFTGSYDNYHKERNLAASLINTGCDVISQHQNSSACREIAKEKKVFCIGYSQSDDGEFSGSYLTSCVFNWGKFALKDIDRYVQGKWEGKKYWEGLESGVVELAPLSESCTPGTEKIVEDAKFRIENKMFNVFQGPVYDCEGNLVVKEGSILSEDEIWNMNWVVKGVVER